MPNSTDLNIKYIGKSFETDNDKLLKQSYKQYYHINPADIILNFDSSNSVEDIKILSNNIKINISKENSSFDFAEKFREFLINGEYKNNDNLINFINDSGNEIGKLLYERIQNFIYNNVNIDTCHYNNLISYYDAYGIEIDKVFLNGIPEKLEYLINMLSLPKQYYKSSFYNMTVTDQTFTMYASNISDEDSLNTFNKALNRKYFDNFYENVAYPIIRQELMDMRDDKTVWDYITISTNNIFDTLDTHNNAEYLFLNYVVTTLSDSELDRICSLMTATFLKENLNFKILENNSNNSSNEYYISKDYFKKALTSDLSYIKTTDGELPTIDLSNSFVGIPVISNINYKNPTYLDVFDMFETYCCTRNEFIDILKIRLCAKKLANACNSICKLREEIKELRLKFSKVGTAALIEQLIAEFIYKNLTKKVGLTNQKMVASDLTSLNNAIQSLDDTIPEEKLAKENLTQILDAKQKAIGIEFEQYLDSLSEVVNKLKIDIVEYYDTTPSYFNIIPEKHNLTERKTYKQKVVEFTPYLNILGNTIYADFDNKNDLKSFKLGNILVGSPNFNLECVSRLKQCAIGEESTGYTYYFDGNPCIVSNENGFEEIRDKDGKLLYQEQNKFTFTQAVNLNKPDVSYNTRGWYEFSKQQDIPYIAGAKYTQNYIIDTYDRIIKHDKNTILTDVNGSTYIEWTNDILKSDFVDNPLFLAEATNDINTYFIKGFYAVDNNITRPLRLLKSSTPDSYSDYGSTASSTSDDAYFGAYFNTKTNEVSETLKDGFDWFWVIKTSLNSEAVEIQVSEINSTAFFKFFYQPYGVTTVIDSFNAATSLNYQIQKSESFYLLDSNEKVVEQLGCTRNNEIYNSEGMVLNYYSPDLENFYKIVNSSIVVKTEEVDVLTVLEGEEAFWTDLQYNTLYGDKSIEEEADIIRFYKRIGLINDDLTDSPKAGTSTGLDSMSQSWINARYNIIKKLKAFWSVNAPHSWYDPSDETRFKNNEITLDTLNNLKNMDIAYHSNISRSMEYSPSIKLNNSLTNLSNWSNNTVAIHPCIWNLVEAAFDSYIKIYSISLFGQDILNKIYSNAFNWPLQIFNPGDGKQNLFPTDADGLFSVATLKKMVDHDNETIEETQYEVHNVNYWRNYSKDMFAYTTHYEASDNEDKNNAVTSRFIDFDGPFNYEGLMQIINQNFKKIDFNFMELDKNNNIAFTPDDIDIEQLKTYYTFINTTI